MSLLSPSLLTRDSGRVLATLLALPLLLLSSPTVWSQNAADDDTAAARLFLESERHLERGDVDAALAELNALVARLPNSRLAPKAMLEVARIQIDATRYRDALKTTESMIERYPGSPESAGAAVLASQVAFEQAESVSTMIDARTEMRRIPNLFGPNIFPRLVYRSEARVRAADISSRLGEFTEAAADYLAAIEDEPSSAWTARARIGLARVFLSEGQAGAAAEELQQVLFSGEDSATVEERAEAKRLLSLLHRLFLRAQEGQKAWQKTTLFTPPGAQLRKPNGIAADTDGRMVITDGAGSVYLLDAEGQRLLYATTKSPRRPLFDIEGNAWFLTNMSIEAMTGPRMARLLVSGRSKPLNKIAGAQQGAFGEWVVVDGGLKGVSVYDSDRTNKGNFATSTLPKPADVARDNRGKVFILDTSNRTIMSLTPNRRPDRRVNVSSESPEALAIDELGNFYVLDGQNRTVDIYDAAGRSIQSLGPVLPNGIELRRPTDVAVDGHGVIYVADPKLDAIAVIE